MPHFYVTVFICIATFALRADQSKEKDYSNDFKALQASKYLRSGVDEAEFRLSNEPSNEEEDDDEDNGLEIQRPRKSDLRKLRADAIHSKKAKIANREKILRKNKEFLKGANYRSGIPMVSFRKDPVLNFLNSRTLRRAAAAKPGSSSSSSSSLEMPQWKTEWAQYWLQKQFESVNSTIPTGDMVSMTNVRPWGLPCGDPAQHDMPWGTCMLSMECEPEFRIYRGDYMCGRTSHVCCVLQATTYDVYQGFDFTYEAKGLSTDTEEVKENSKKKKKKNNKKKKNDRNRRKKRITKNIRKVIKEITKLLKQYSKNSTKQKTKYTKLIKKFVKDLKKKYKADRLAVKNLHEEQMIKIDAKLLRRLEQVRKLNQNFMKNATFRDMIANHTMTRLGARMLLEAYPDLSDAIPLRRALGPDYDFDYGFPVYN